MTMPARDLPTRLRFPSASGSLFEDYFARKDRPSFQKQDLIDARAKRLFETTALSCQADAYPFQVPLEGKSGPYVKADGHEMLMLSSYDYLGLIGHARVERAAVEAVRRYGTGTGGVRLLTGTNELHREMEQELASFLGTEEVISFSSGYLANLAVISALFGPTDRVIADSLSHRSLIDACRLAGVPVERFKHNDMDSLRQALESKHDANRTLIISDGVFSMDGDICKLPEILALKREFRAFLLIDDSHSLGVLGPAGRGTGEHFGIRASEVDIWTGSLAKAIPSNGGYVAVSQELAIYLQHAAAPFIFSAALCPAAAASVQESIHVLRDEPERVERSRKSATRLRSGLQRLGFNTGLSETPIVPVLLGDDRPTALLARRLRDYGVLTTPVLFPAVPMGAGRLRLCATAAHTTEHIDFALEAFEKVAGEFSC